jgi:Kae1-associated kinase Bud32
MKLIAQGAEAKIYLEGDKIIKERVRKRYRNKELDEFLRKTRTKKEIKLLSDLRRLGLNVPRIIDYDKFKIVMEFIEGKKLKDVLSEKNFKKFCEEIGKNVAKMHLADIIHGDLTTANIIVKDNELYFIDFGLAIETKNLEQKAADLLTLYQNFRSVHPELNCWDYFLRGYKNKETEKILLVFEKMLKRRRYFK